MTIITDEMVQLFLGNWYRMMDQHAPLQEVLKSIDPSNFRMQIINGPIISGEQGFSEWYKEKVATSFDSQHIVHSIDYKIDGDTVEGSILADWSGRNWIIPQIKSEPVAFKDKLLVKLKYDEQAGQLRFTDYRVKSAD